MGAQWKQKSRTENAAARGRIFGKLAREVMVAAKSGPDPDSNARLAMAVAAAKKASMPKDTLERAIKKGAGLLDEPVNFEIVTYEGYAPHQVPVVVECLTDNRARTASNVRMLFRKGQLGASGSVTWDFKRVGVIEAAAPAAGADAETAAIEAGAQEVEAADDGEQRFIADSGDLDSVRTALGSAGWKVSSAKLAWVAKNPASVEGPARKEVEDFLVALDEDDDVQEIFVGLKG